LAALAALGQQFAVHRTLLVLPEAERERVPEAFEAEMVRAACVRAVQKRAMQVLLRHASSSAADAIDIGLGLFRT
jgi:hypothetical protein